ncbi:PLP-dependent aminotransferase family protein [Cellulomonas sp. Y8]|uniref:MocR-like pyridoxine biosynthesis transcription factor PdxR n=1 Tax=Cellulomonas sp. Y8 TaxID=2591145 RepID=UPI0011CCB578|nr:PLP-dependent aminotransferase family protein [Cellulomonas sp. Y8]
MRATWAIGGLDLFLDLRAARPRRGLEDALRAAVTEGRLAPGTRLPATRSVAADLGVARNTVAQVYEQLAAEGWLTSRVGAGTWVAEPAASPAPAEGRPTGQPAAGSPGPPAGADLRAGIPDAAAFPRREWAAAVRRAVLDSPAGSLGYPDPRGVPAAREALAGYLARTRGVRATSGRVLLARGFGGLLAAACRALAAAGATRVAVEEYGHARHRDAIVAAGLAVVPLPVDRDGADVAQLAELGVDAVLLTPAHQFPTGVALAPDRRTAVVRWAAATGALVLEDDYDGEFRYDRRAVGALQALAPEHVLYAGTASKSVGPGLGLAWAVAPERLVAPLARQTELLGGGPPAVDQLALAGFVEAHDLDRSVRRLRQHYRARRARVEAVVAERLPACAVAGLPAGLHCLVELPAGTSETAVVAAAARRGVRLEGLSAFAAPGTGRGRGPAVVVGYGAPGAHAFDAVLAAAAEAIADVLD